MPDPSGDAGQTASEPIPPVDVLTGSERVPSWAIFKAMMELPLGLLSRKYAALCYEPEEVPCGDARGAARQTPMLTIARLEKMHIIA